MKLLTTFILGMTLALGAACQAQTTDLGDGASAVSSDDGLASLKEAVSAYYSAMANLDAEGAAAFYAGNVLVVPDRKEDFRGKTAAEEYLKAATETPGFQATFETLAVELTGSGATGYSVAIARISTRRPGAKPVIGVTRDVHVWERGEDGAWRIVLDTWNAAPPAQF